MTLAHSLTDHFTWDEVTHSSIALRLGIDNTILPSKAIDAVYHTASCMENVRAALDNRAINIDSWYRCGTLNMVVGSKKTSQHIKGEAVDFTCPSFGSPADVCKAIIRAGINFDQLILEHTWVHISFQSNPNIEPRNEVLTLLPATQHYAEGLTDIYGKILP